MANTSAVAVLANTRAVVAINVAVKLEISVEVIPVANVSQSLQSGSTYSEEHTKTASTSTISDWRRVAKLARIAIAEEEIIQFCAQLNSIMAFVEQLAEVNVEGVEPMTSVTPMAMKKRHDVVTAGDDAAAVLKNAPESADNFFLVPKVVE